VPDELSETHGHEVNQLKEELQLKDAAVAKVLNNAEQLKVNVTKLMETKKNKKKAFTFDFGAVAIVTFTL